MQVSGKKEAIVSVRGQCHMYVADVGVRNYCSVQKPVSDVSVETTVSVRRKCQMQVLETIISDKCSVRCKC